MLRPPFMNPSRRFFAAAFALALACVPIASAGPRHSPDLAALPPKPFTADEAAAYLDKFRHAWFGSDLALRFDFVHRPRRGDETTFAGIAWSTWVDGRPVIRAQLIKPSADKTAPPQVWEWLLQSGPSPKVWLLAPGATAAVEVPSSKWREPFLPGLLYTPFDLMLPFLYWTDCKYNGTDRILGRGVDVYTMNPPPAEKAAGLQPVKIYLDRELDALVRTQQLDAKGKVVQQFDLDKVAKVQGKWMLKSCQLIDEATGDYDIFDVLAAALPAASSPFALTPAQFEPAALGQPMPELPQSAWSGL